ncbi:hypothetical protein J1N35_040877 [Gossypium stocksii]|uniref:RNase H type-1 domain-containing protein n=1 Tax=Gossypium stocksii TaxID=47602 RepID=A0A9D3ZJ73_9ROSI|nr:hypothetical protein J1N35_040877 [Gossypium stocksii]
MWTCGVLQQLWASLSIKLVMNVNTSNYKDRLVNTFLTADINNRQVLIIFIWALWHRRSKLVPEGLKFHMQDLLGFIRGYCQEISLCQKKLKSFSTTIMHHLWHPPDSVVSARNSEGHFMGACTYSFRDVVDAFVAEARQCKRAMPFTAEKGFWRLLLEGDSLATIKELNSDG